MRPSSHEDYFASASPEARRRLERIRAEVERRLASVQPVETDPAIERELRRLLLAGVDLPESALPAVSPPRAAAPARPRGHQRRRA